MYTSLRELRRGGEAQICWLYERALSESLATLFGNLVLEFYEKKYVYVLQNVPECRINVIENFPHRNTCETNRLKKEEIT